MQLYNLANDPGEKNDLAAQHQDKVKELRAAFDRLAAQADRLSQGEVLRAIDLIAGALSSVKDGTEPRIALEVALLKAVQPASDMSLQALMFRIEQLERGAGGRGQGERREEREH